MFSSSVCAGVHRRFLHFGTVDATAPPSPSWHRRLRRRRAKARALQRSEPNFESLRAQNALELVLLRHGSIVPRRVWQTLRSTPAMLWLCRFCGASNWAKRSTCHRCHYNDGEARAAVMRPPATGATLASSFRDGSGGCASRPDGSGKFARHDGARPPCPTDRGPLAGCPARSIGAPLPFLDTALPPCTVPGPPPAGPPPSVFLGAAATARKAGKYLGVLLLQALRAMRRTSRIFSG